MPISQPVLATAAISQSGNKVWASPANGAPGSMAPRILVAADIPTSTSISGDVTGTLAAAIVAKIQGVAVSATTPLINQTLTYNGSIWIPTTQPSSVYQWTNLGATVASSGTLVYTIPSACSGTSGIIPGNGQVFFQPGTFTINGAITTLTFTSTANVPAVGTSLEYFYPTNLPTGSVSSAVTMTGDVTGLSNSNTVIKINGISVTGTPTSGQVLTIQDPTHANWQTPSIGSISTIAWTNSGSKIASSGTLVYNIPSPASGAIGVIPGNGQLFFQPGTYTIDVGKTQLTFTSTSNVPAVGSLIEYLYFK